MSRGAGMLLKFRWNKRLLTVTDKAGRVMLSVSMLFIASSANLPINALVQCNLNVHQRFHCSGASDERLSR